MAEVPMLELADELKPDLKKPNPKDGHVAVRLQENIVLFGGLYIDSQRTMYYSMRVIWSYNLDIDRWIKLVLPETQATPHPAVGQCAVTIRSDIYLHGGGQHCEGDFLGLLFPSLWKLSGTSDSRITWTQINFPKGQGVPSKRFCHAGWEYQNKLWIFGGFGNCNNDTFHASEDFQLTDHTLGYTNQLWCFDPDMQVWKNVQCTGSKPSPRYCHAITKIRATVWLHGGTDHHGDFDDLYEFNLCSLTWTQIQTVGSLRPDKRCEHSLSAISEAQILLYGGRNDNLSWIFDLPSLSWRQYHAPMCLNGKIIEANGWQNHTSTIGLHSVIIFGGLRWHDDIAIHSNDTLYIMFRPKSLVKSCLEVLCKQRSCLSKCDWDNLPRNLHAQLVAMYELSENEGGDVCGDGDGHGNNGNDVDGNDDSDNDEGESDDDDDYEDDGNDDSDNDEGESDDDSDYDDDDNNDDDEEEEDEESDNNDANNNTGDNDEENADEYGGYYGHIFI